MEYTQFSRVKSGKKSMRPRKEMKFMNSTIPTWMKLSMRQSSHMTMPRAPATSEGGLLQEHIAHVVEEDGELAEYDPENDVVVEDGGAYGEEKAPIHEPTTVLADEQPDAVQEDARWRS
jgi:hypothetical protein